MSGPTHISVAVAGVPLAAMLLAAASPSAAAPAQRAMTALLAASTPTANSAGEAPQSEAPQGQAPQGQARAKHMHRRRHRLHSPPTATMAPASAAAAAVPSNTTADDVNAQVGQIGASVMSILGRKVLSPQGGDLGRVVDVLADSSGRVRVAIIDFGGFLGVGNHRIAVDWPLLRFDPGAGDKSSVTLAVSREKLQAAPEYEESEHPRVLLPSPVAASANAAEDAHTNRK